MPSWTDQPPTSAANYPLRILRTPAKGTITAIVTSTELQGCPTHYCNNRTVPCEGADTCKLCADGYSWRWHGYVACILKNSLEHILFEFTAAASDTFRNYIALHNEIRGCLFKASRPSGRPNGRVVIEASPADLSRLHLPNPPNIRKILCHIWGIQYQEPDYRRMPRPPYQDARPKLDGNGEDSHREKQLLE
jgi:hypothetical protein